MKGFTITAIVLLAMYKVCGAGALTINSIQQPHEQTAQDSVPKKTFNSNKHFLGTAPLGIILSRPRVQYERQPGKVGIGGIYTRYDAVWRGDKIEPFARLYLNSQSALRMFFHLQVGVGRYRIPYTKVTTVGADSGFEFPNYEIRKHTLSYGTGVGFGAKLVTKKDFFFDLCVRHQYYELASQNPVTIEKDNATHTYYPSRGNGFFRATGPGAEWVCSFVLGWAL